MSRFDGEVVSVSELIERARQALDRSVGMVAVEGEVFEYRGPHSSGHYYFKLRDGEASIDVKMWRGTAARGLRCALEEGRAVLGIGKLDVWPKRGMLSFLLEEVHDLGAGDLARRFEELKQRLLREGLFEEGRKRALPARPRRVGLITAVPSAAAADVEQTWEDLGAPFEVVRIPSRVQGQGAELDLIRALRQAADQQVDVILLTRGGGSLEDLWAFNEEALVRAVAASPVPVVCAVGHETDFTLCDFAADQRCKTPTAGAALLADGWIRAARQLLRWAERLHQSGDELVALAAERLTIAAGTLPLAWREHRRTALRRWEQARLQLSGQRPDRRLARAQQRLAEAEWRFFQVGEAGLARRRARLQRQARRLQAAGLRQRLDALRGSLLAHRGRLEAGSPTALLQRGYALVTVEGRTAYLRDAAAVEVGQALQITLAKGALRARVEQADSEPSEA